MSLGTILRKQMTQHGDLNVGWERMRRQELLKRRRIEITAAESQHRKSMTWKNFTEGASEHAKRSIRPKFLEFLALVRDTLGQEAADPESVASGARVLYKAINMKKAKKQHKKEVVFKYLGRMSDKEFEGDKLNIDAQL
eukprot:jgi/Bigna1/77448/fgenesh1_pg.48_\